MTLKRFGKMLKRIRQEKELTQDALAKKAGISRVYLAQLEGSAKRAPIRTPSMATLERLAKALKVKVGDLLK